MPKVVHTSTGNITEHVKLIHRQVLKSIEDPELRQLAVKIVSGSFEWRADPRSGQQKPFIKAWGKWFIAPPELPCEPRDAQCELAKVWNFVVLNVRYVYDPVTIDTFATAKETLLAGGGDCFPVGTRVTKRGVGRCAACNSYDPPKQVPISTIVVGDWIHDGSGDWVEVLKTWDRGAKKIYRFVLQSGATVRLSDTHKMLVLKDGADTEVRAHAIQVGDMLLAHPDTLKFAPGSTVVRAIEVEANKQACVDIMTSSGRVYLPESDVIVRQCDDMDILFEALLNLIGFQTKARVISTNDNPDEWVHIYPLCGLDKDSPRVWVPLDATVTGKEPGWEYEDIAQHKDFVFRG